MGRTRVGSPLPLLPWGLRFRIRGSRKANTVTIRLDAGADLYDVEIGKLGRAPGFKYTVVESTKGAYVDMLRDLIERGTGLRTSLGTIRR